MADKAVFVFLFLASFDQKTSFLTKKSTQTCTICTQISPLLNFRITESAMIDRTEAKETDTTTVGQAEIEPATLEKVENELVTLVTDFQITGITEKRRDTIKVLI